ncbi:MAG: bifunctional riboflavin kinase/FAD synthetase [Rhizobiales bacterium]|nr:bifunctional riboflavin kinase/FAD synthetase [Hyphomicrobiales bacterium]
MTPPLGWAMGLAFGLPAMQLLHANQSFPSHYRGAAIAIGNFDGMHRGHQSLIGTAIADAAASGAAKGLVTFEPHPRTFFRPAEPVFRLTPLPLKARLAGSLGLDFVLSFDFDAALASLPPEEFVETHLVKRMGLRHLVTGYDFHFGKGRKGSPDTMRDLGHQHGFTTTVVDQVTDDNGLAPFSSSAIRNALAHGRLNDAAHDLGYNWMVLGEVVHGDHRGREIGFPTANIVVDEGVEPLQGIYAVFVRDAEIAGSPRRLGAGYFGKRPTFDTDRTFLEVYILDFSGDLYGRKLLVEFVALIRPDQKFTSIDELVVQMHRDCDEARRLLAMADANPANSRLGELQRAGMI